MLHDIAHTFGTLIPSIPNAASFPTLEDMLFVSAEELYPIGVGYRAPYVMSAVDKLYMWGRRRYTRDFNDLSTFKQVDKYT